MRLAATFLLFVPSLLVMLVVTVFASPRVIQVQFAVPPIVAGESGSLTVRFRIAEGFKIPKRPSPKLLMHSTAEVKVEGNPVFTEQGSGPDPEYYKGLKPVTVHLTPSPTARRGSHVLEGTFTYFYCSEKDKYCSRSVENLKIPLEVVDLKQ